MAIDPAGRGKDETGYAVVKMLHGNLYLTASGGLLNGYSTESLKKLSEVAREQNVNQMIVESNFGDGMFSQLLKPVLASIYPCTIEEVRHSTQKEKRIIDTLEPVFNSHKLIVDEKIIKDDFESTQDLKYKLFYQITRLTRDRGALIHDDRLEALSMAVNYWTEIMDRDAEDAVSEHKENLLREELDRFMEHNIGRQKQNHNWINR